MANAELSQRIDGLLRSEAEWSDRALQAEEDLATTRAQLNESQNHLSHLSKRCSDLESQIAKLEAALPVTPASTAELTQPDPSEFDPPEDTAEAQP